MKSDFEVTVADARPCPFCGGTDITTMRKDFFDENKLRLLIFKCEGCWARITGDVHDDYEGAFESALEKWNRRA